MQTPTLAAWHVPTRQIRRDRWPALVVVLLLFGLFPILDDDPDAIDWLVALGLAIAIWLLTGRSQKRKGRLGRGW
jgi:hypothetical protein